jgi:SAM-dependent methyltransferase
MSRVIQHCKMAMLWLPNQREKQYHIIIPRGVIHFMDKGFKELPVTQKLINYFNPESEIGGFSKVDGMIEFYNRIHSILKPDWVVLDYGAGRGLIIDEDISPYRKELKTLKGKVKHLVGCDVDEVVKNNIYLDEAHVIEIGKSLPFDNEQFDLVYSTYVFEHIAEPNLVARELMRITKPGGWIIAVTPNKIGYVAIAAMLVKNKFHIPLLKFIQPERKEIDTFPTQYKMNTKKSLRKLFRPASKIVIYPNFADPTYHFNSYIMYFLFKLLHKLLPNFLGVSYFIFIQK